MEKFGYPAWYTPLLEKKPYLARFAASNVRPR
jgi:hypothetical protein